MAIRIFAGVAVADSMGCCVVGGHAFITAQFHPEGVVAVRMALRCVLCHAHAAQSVGEVLRGAAAGAAGDQLARAVGGVYVHRVHPGAVVHLGRFDDDFAVGALVVDSVVGFRGRGAFLHQPLDAPAAGVVAVFDGLGTRGDFGEPVVGCPGVLRGACRACLLGQVASVIPCVAGGAVQAVAGLHEAVVCVVLVGGDLPAVAHAALGAVACCVVLVRHGAAERCRCGLRDLLLLQFACRVVLVADGAFDGFAGGAHARQAFVHLRALACCVERVGEAGDFAAVGLAVRDGCELAGFVVLVAGGAAVGTGDAAAVARVVVRKAGHAAVGVRQGFELVERVVAGLDGLARGADLRAVAVAVPGVVDGGAQARAQGLAQSLVLSVPDVGGGLACRVRGDGNTFSY